MNKRFWRLCLLLVLNTVPFFLGCLLYQCGSAIFMMFLYIQIAVNVLNYKWTNKIISFLFFNTAMLVSSIASIETTTQLYYNNISSDNGTLAVGDFAVKVGFVFITLMTLVSVFYRIVSRKPNRQ